MASILMVLQAQIIFKDSFAISIPMDCPKRPSLDSRMDILTPMEKWN